MTTKVEREDARRSDGPPASPLASLFGRHPELRPLEGPVAAAYETLRTAFRGDHRALVCGNGGSAADAEHIVGELMKSMLVRRPVPTEVTDALAGTAPPELGEEARYLSEHLEGALPAISLGSQTSLLSAVANDTAADMVFAQQVHGYGRPGDVLWALSTSGRSRNVVLAALTARAQGMRVVALTGEPGEPLGDLADVWIRVPAASPADAQELHVAVYHSLCAALETEIFGV